MAEPSTLILASASSARARLLTQVGVPFTAVASHVDEDVLKWQLRGQSPGKLALALANAKAAAIAEKHPDALVLGGDQVLACRGRLLDKPANRAAAKKQLAFMAGHWHVLHTAAVIRQGKRRLWSHVAQPAVKLRKLTPSEIDRYLRQAGDSVLSSVGVYHIEGLGPLLFEQLRGDPLAIQGLPLLPLLAFLRRQGWMV